MNDSTIKTKLQYSELFVTLSRYIAVNLSPCRKLKERISQLDQENTSLTKAHVERFIHAICKFNFIYVHLITYV